MIKNPLNLFLLFFLIYLPANAQNECSVNGLRVDARTKSTPLYTSYSTRVICQLPEFYENSRTVATNIYGSRTDKQTNATGFYYSKFIDGRWWVVDPQGYLSICRGLNSISQGVGTTSKTTFNSKFGTTATWMNKTKDLLFDNGFYCAGAWSSTADVVGDNNSQPSKPMAYTIMLYFMNGFGAGRTSIQPGHAGYPFNAIFVFEKAFATYCDNKAKALANNKTDKNLFGYFTDNELPFFNASLTNFLKIGTVAPQDENYLATKKWLADNSLTEADATNTDVKARFLGYVAQTYFSIVYNAIKKYDPNHMVLGPRVNAAEARDNKYFMNAAGQYVDILAINYYGVWTPNTTSMIKWGQTSGKPFMVTEFYTKGADVGLANTSGAGWIVKTQLDRGFEYQNYTLALLESKYCVGWNWFKYMDNDPSIPNAEPSNTDANKGIISIKYQGYMPLLDKMKELNFKVYNLIDYFDKVDTDINNYSKLPAYLSDLFINDIRISAFNPDTLSYEIMLQEGPMNTPKIQFSLPNLAMKATILNPINIQSTSIAERTASITVTSADGLKTRKYEIVFKLPQDVSAVPEIKSFNFDFYPNPVNKNDVLTFRNTDANNSLLINNITGKQVYALKLNESISTLPLNGLLCGLYLVSLTNETGITTKKLIVK